MAKAIGPTFYADLAAAGVTDLRFSWSPNGAITFDPACTSVAAVKAVYAAHDPTRTIAPTLSQLIGPTDHEMARAGEDLFAVLLTKGTITKADLPAVVVQRINARRALRGQAAI